MKLSDCFELGFVTKTHGLKGFVTVFLDTDNPQDYFELESVFLEIKGELIPFFIEDMMETNQVDKIIVKFEDIETVEQAQSLIKAKLFLPAEFLPDLGKNKFYYHEVVGFLVSDKTVGNVGKINTILESPALDYLQVDYKGKEVLIPIEDSFIIEVDKKKKQIIVDLPDGLLDL